MSAKPESAQPVSAKPPFQRVLIANRGDVALRIVRACREMGIETVAAHSRADETAMHVRLADHSVCIGPAPSRDSYLNEAAIITAAHISGADAIHPGIGFLSENTHFAKSIEDHGLTFIGPNAHMIATMGDKVTAKQAAVAAGIPVVPGSPGELDSIEHAKEIAKDIGYPVLLKATAGGGGRGMQIAQTEADIENAYNLASSEARIAFGNGALYLEKYLGNPRHIEIQVLGDKHGNAVHLGERDCSIQRRHQKLWEEAPSPVLSAEERARIGEISANAVAKLGYDSVGTIEYLYENGEFYFIEMNTRLQVEHPITEMITGKDLVREQILVAAGNPLPFTQDEITFEGHAIECRINAEHPRTFAPSPGKITGLHAPGGLGIRIDSQLYTGYQIPPHYDSLVAKLIAHGPDRETCMARLGRALQEYAIDGIETAIPLHLALKDHPDVQSGNYTIKWLEEQLEAGTVFKD